MPDMSLPPARKRIVLVTNSQGSSLGVPMGSNYPSVLQELLGPDFDLHWLLISGWTVRELITNLADNVLVWKPDLLVVHLGMVECSQRILSVREKNFMSLLPFGRSITAFLHRRRRQVLRCRHRLGISTRVVPPGEFAAAIREIEARAAEHGIRTLFLPTFKFADAGASLDHPFVNEDIEQYNRMLPGYGEVPADILNQYGLSTIYQSQNVHFNENGHRVVAEILAAALRKKLGC